ncbi:MAG: type II toxin-antitoxin system RelE/ParE family toxin [Elusimicrobia bacterium]|nr:type II toxin-antitoxin system RelE/ParE family toxin [Elusimicrobiota bacterium]
MSRRAVRWSAEAEHNLDDIAARIALDSPERALAFARRLLAKVGRLSLFPESGRTVPELADLDSPPREVIVGDYRVIYRLADKAVEITAVFHGRRKLPKQALDAPPISGRTRFT